MRIAIGSDHAGFRLKGQLDQDLRDWGHDVSDVGTFDAQPADYPDSAEAVGLTILQGQAERGVLICGSGVGASVAANKLPGIRAGLCHDPYSARQGVEHDDINVLVLGSRLIEYEIARELLGVFLQSRFTSEDRHRKRLDKIRSLEHRYGIPKPTST